MTATFTKRALVAAALVCSAGTAHAELQCDEVMTMVGYGIGESVIVQAMQSSGGRYTEDQLACLEARGASAGILAAARAMGGSAPMTRPTPTEPTPNETLEDDPGVGAEELGDPEADVGSNVEVEEFDEERGPAQVEELVAMYRAKKYLTASKGLFDLLQEDTYPEHKSKITYYLAKSLFDLGMFHGAQHYYMEVVRQGPRNPYFKYALPRLVEIAEINSNDTELLRIVDRIPAEQFPRQAKNHLSYLMGRKLYEQGELAEALAFFQQVSPRSELYMRSKFYEGVISNDMSKARSAVKAFRDVYQAEVPPTDSRTAQELRDLQDLALLDIARIYYGLDKHDNADNYYSLVDRNSRYWPQSVFERSWSTFMGNDLNHTLGLLLTVRTPYYDETEFLPEATVLRALTFFQICEYDEVERILLEFEASHKPMRDELRDFTSRYASEEGRGIADQAYEHYFQNEHPDSVLPEAFFARVLRNRDVAGVVRHLDMMEAEIALIDAQKSVWRDSVGAAVRQAIEEDRMRYKKRAGLAMLQEMTRQEAYINDLISQSEIIRFEVVDAQRADYQFRAQNAVVESDDERKIDFATSRDVIYWPFNGEFWQDELGYYRYTERTSCE